MTDVRELLGSALQDEPATTIDPYAAMESGRRHRRGRRYRWVGAGAAAAVVATAVVVVGLPSAGPSTTGPATAGQVGWVATEPSGNTARGLDPARTLANLDGTAERVQQLLGLPAVGPADSYSGLGHDGALELAYRAAGDVAVNVLLQGPQAGPAVHCPAAVPGRHLGPDIPSQWPAAPQGPRQQPIFLLTCASGPVLAATAQGSLVTRVAATQGLTGGAVGVTVTSDAEVAPPVAVAQALSVVDLLAGTLVFQDKPDRSRPTTVGPSWVVTEGTADTGPYLDPGRTLAKLDGVADQVQGLLGLPAAGAAEPYRGVGRFGAVQLAYRTADDLEVHVLFSGPLSHWIPGCVYPLPPPAPDDWPVEPAGTRPTAPSLCGPDVAVATTVAGPGRVARTVAAWGDQGGQLSVTLTSGADAPPPASLAVVRSVVDLLAGTAVFQPVP